MIRKLFQFLLERKTLCAKAKAREIGLRLAEGRYRLREAVYIWPRIGVIGYGATRPVIVLPANTVGYQDDSKEKVMIIFAGGRPEFGRGRPRNPVALRGPVPNASPGTFYSALAGIHEGGNVVEDVRFFGVRCAVWTLKPSPRGCSR